MDLQELLELVQKTQAGEAWDISALIRVGGTLAAKLNGLQNLTGQEKKTLVCQVLLKSLDAAEKKEHTAPGVSTEEQEKIQARFADLKHSVQTVLPATLDLAVAAARGKLDLKKISPSVWAQAFSCCLKTTVSALASQNLISESHAQQAFQLHKKFDSVVPQAQPLPLPLPTPSRRSSQATKAGTGIASQTSQKQKAPEVA